MTSFENQGRSIASDKHLAATERSNERIREAYQAACRQHRFGRNPAEREAGRAEALRLRPAIHGS